jgi:murein DD-endopeptidase MepM/ murein hydrolase activator NlpD
MNEDRQKNARALANQATTLLSTARRQIDTMRRSLRNEDARFQLLVLVGRLTSHIAIVAVSILAVVLASLNIGAKTSLAEDKSNAPSVPGGKQGSVGRSPTILLNPQSPGLPGSAQQAGAVFSESSAVMREAVFESAPPPAEKRVEILSYEVQSGDFVETIAARYSLLPTTLVWSNQDVEDNPNFLKIGQRLTIIPVDGVYHTVKEGDTVSGIAKRFKVEEKDILGFPSNNLKDGANLIVGTRLVIPGGVKETAPRAAQPVAAPVRRLVPVAQSASGGGAPTGTFRWPTVGAISQGFWSFHRALDIANSTGTPIYASDGGCVLYAGWSNVGYGYMVQLSHGNGFSTLYGHMNYYYVDPGQCVSKGQIIGLMGSTGNSTGPHLHFEIRYGGATQNPLAYLP